MPNNYIYLILKTGSLVRTPSPRTRQVSWNNMFFSDMGGDGSYKTFSGHQAGVLYASFSPTGDEVVSCCSDGFVKVIFCIVCPLQISVTFGLRYSAKRYNCVSACTESQIYFLFIFLKVHLTKVFQINVRHLLCPYENYFFLGYETFWLNVQVPVCCRNVDSILPSCMDSHSRKKQYL